MIAAASILAVIVLGAVWSYLAPRLKGEQLWEEKTIELGDTLTEDPSYYMSGSDWVIDHTVIDVSRVKTDTVGDYKIRAISPFSISTFSVHVDDTVPPEITIGSGWKTVLETGKMYDPEILGIEVSDLSGLTFVKYYYNGQSIDKLMFTKPGNPEITIKASDGNANISEQKVKLFVDSPPKFYGVHDQYLLIGSTEADLDPVFAKDEVDGGLTSEIKTDLTNVDFNHLGDYRVTYSVSDGYGLFSSVSSTIHIVSSKKTVEQQRDKCVILKEDLQYAVDEGFFTYEPNNDNKRKWVIDNCDKTLINLFVANDDGSTSSGSAFIYEITPEYVYMVSVYHVTSALESEPIYITFYDGTKIRTTIRSIRLSAGNEASLFRIAVSSIPYHTFIRLKEVTTEKDIYDHVTAGTPLIEYSKNWRGGEIPTLIRDTSVISFSLSDIQRKFVDNDSYFTVVRKSVSGMSGTAVFDYRGVLAGICSKTMYPLESEEPQYRDGCDFVLMVDDLDDLMDRAKELAR
ncbi:MAG: DUF5011 domain-containing protein [Lachnospiraceae bacterium]|nr:DUF5011 domain-containing protein [Lachnospiraceae bacterium]